MTHTRDLTVPNGCAQIQVSAPHQSDIDAWRRVMNSLRVALEARRVTLHDHDLRLVARFFMEETERKGDRLVPAKANNRMMAASRNALRHCHRASFGKLGERKKHKYRWKAAIQAAPDWRQGYNCDGG